MSARPDIVLTLPVPPSTNALWITPRHHKSRIRSPAYSAWLTSAGWEARRQLVGVPTITGLFSARIEVPARSRRDLDNWQKAIFDLCQSIRAIRNDSGLRGFEVVPADRDDVLVRLTDLGGPEQIEPKVYRVGKPRAARPTQGKLAAYRRAGVLV